MKNSRGKIIGLIVIACLILVNVISCVMFFSPYHQIERCYKENKASFQQIVQTFKNRYTDSLNSVIYSLDDHSFTLNFNHAKDIVDDSNEDISEILEHLQEQYRSQSDLSSVFSTVNAYFDQSGNMLLYLIAQKDSNGKDADTSKCYYLIYIDDSYYGHNSDLAIDNSDISKKPFADNWYTWSKNVPLG